MEQPNISYIQQLSGGDISFEKKILTILKDEFPEEKKVYFDHFDKKNFKLTADSVHKLKHKISILGLEKGYEIAVAFENNLRNDDISLSNKFESILNTMTNYLKQL